MHRLMSVPVSAETPNALPVAASKAFALMLAWRSATSRSISATRNKVTARMTIRDSHARF